MGTVESCPHCQQPYGGCFMHINSGLGSSNYFCGLCGKPFASNRREWPDLDLLGRARYIGASILYVGFVCVMHGLCLCAIICNLTGYSMDIRFDSFWRHPIYVGCALFMGGMVTFLQWRRVRKSVERWLEDPDRPTEAYFFSFETNRQLIVLAAGIMIGALAAATA